TTVSLEPGATVLLYTDGLIERPGVSLDEGLEWLRGLVSSSSDLEDLCSMLLRASFHEASQADDVALLAVRLEAVEPEAMELTLAAEPETLAYMRRVLGRWLRAAGANDAETYEILVACGEACANAVTHAYPAGDTSSYVVEARQRDGVVEIEVRDFGRWRTRVGSEGGGLRLISQLADELDLDRAATGTVVRMRRAVGAPPPQAPQGHR
ncbi:MAG TPA: ATP-binding protein, partial [Solirubrobacterales bacterium]|nr:ATP-binding protein [Solirubrobacterales bacterium]